MATAEVTGPATLRPPEGVYEYAGEGSERISFPPVSQQDGAVIPGTVTHGADGCWVFRLDYNAAHWQDWRYCPSGGVIADTGGRTHQTLGLRRHRGGESHHLPVRPSRPAVPTW